MEDLFNKVKSNVINYHLIENGDRIVMGVSGGPDSIFLLHALDKLKKEKIINFDIIVAHVNHMIREEAIEDENLVIQTCEKMGYEYKVIKANIPELSNIKKISEEECGRLVRYDFFEKVLKEMKCNKVAVAHNQTDNIETVIMNFIRGTGIKGLCGMDFSSNEIIRPILNIKKKDIINFLDKSEIKYAIDRTNNDNIYTRNRIRNDLITKIEKEYNSNFIETTQRMIELNRQDNRIIEDYVEKSYESIDKKVEKDKIEISIKDFQKLDNNMKGRVVRKILEELLGNLQDIQKVHIEDINKLLNNNITNKKYIIGNKFTVTIIRKNWAEFKINK